MDKHRNDPEQNEKDAQIARTSGEVEHLLWRLRSNKTAKSLCGLAADTLERLLDRLEMRHAWQMVDGKLVKVTVPIGSIPDGIECRDETIRQLQRALDRREGKVREDA